MAAPVTGDGILALARDGGLVRAHYCVFGAVERSTRTLDPPHPFEVTGVLTARDGATLAAGPIESMIYERRARPSARP